MWTYAYRSAQRGSELYTVPSRFSTTTRERAKAALTTSMKTSSAFLLGGRVALMDRAVFASIRSTERLGLQR